MSEVEKLKAQRREANAAKREASGETATETTAPAVDRSVEAPQSGALAQIASAEAKAAALLSEIVSSVRSE